MISSILKVVQGIVKLKNSSGTIIDPATLTEQQTQTASLSVMDDWDESDRAKANIIVGQAGVQGASGIVSANTQRVVLATDVALPTGTNSIGQVTANAGTNLNTSALALETTQAAANVLIGAVTETAPASDTASSGLNGRLQRIAQRLTSLITATTDRTQKTQLTNGTIDNALLATTPALADNAIVVRPLPYEPQTYSASASGFVSAATATDVFTITGSGTKTVRVHKIRVSGTTTSGSAIKLVTNLIKRSTADSGGTRVAATVVPNDSNNAAGTATVGHYTANPTLGTTVGTIRSTSSAVTASGLSGGDLTFEFNSANGQVVTLRGTSEQLAVNFNSTTITGPVISISVEWSEV